MIDSLQPLDAVAMARAHHVVLRHDRDHHGWVSRALPLVNGCGVCRHRDVETLDVESSGPANDESRAREMHCHISDDRVVSADRDFIDRQCNQFSRDRVSSSIVGCDADLLA